MYEFVIAALRNLNDLLTAGIAITAFSLLLYALSFNLRNRVARSFAFIMFCVVVIFVSEAMSSLTSSPDQIEIWLRLQWLGIVFLPPSYLHLSDAILATTGRPSRGRRRMAVRVIYLMSLAFLLALPFSLLVGPLDPNAKPVPHLQLTWLTIVFAFYYLIVMLVAWINLWRARNRTKASASNRRMIYLLAGSLAPAIGSFPFLLFGSGFASDHPLIFWLTVNLINILVTIFLILMAYSVAYFGVPWPDRVVKRRLFKWLLRGPFTASTTLALTTLVVRSGWLFGLDLNSFVPAVMVTSIVTIEHLITLVSPIIERMLFRERDQADMELLQSLEDRLLTRGDLKQFLEAILNAACDRLQTPNAFIATLTRQGIDMFITIGGDSQLMLGLLGIHHQADQKLDTEQVEALRILTERAAMALRDRRRQQQAFSSLEALTPQMDMIQQWRATARYDGTEVLSAAELPIEQKTLSVWVKDALTHYWGGPKLTQSPLLRLQVVQKSLEQYDENPTNTLRAVLRQAIDQVRPEGERRFTGEWILYNILEMKFMEGRKVRDVAMRLAMSEADLYRKQRVAIEAVTDTILTMEQQARQEDAQNADGNKHMLDS
jgi:hypothetical protein